MLRNLKDLERYKVTATDGDVGHVVDFLLDDECWVIRYLRPLMSCPSSPNRNLSMSSLDNRPPCTADNLFGVLADEVAVGKDYLLEVPREDALEVFADAGLVTPCEPILRRGAGPIPHTDCSEEEA